MAVFPIALAEQQDSRYYSETFYDNAVKGEIEGGYTSARPRTTRPPRYKWTTGFSDLTHGDYIVLRNFYREVGTHTTFEWINPTTQETKLVRFEKPFTAKYTGAGGQHYYAVEDITLAEY